MSLGYRIQRSINLPYVHEIYNPCFSVGQCGNQIGCRFWDLALREHAHVNKVSRSMQIWWRLQLMNYGLSIWISAKKVV